MGVKQSQQRIPRMVVTLPLVNMSATTLMQPIRANTVGARSVPPIWASSLNDRTNDRLVVLENA